MLKIRRSHDRGHANHGWLDTHHTFSFAGYYDPAHMGFRSLRVLNDDIVEPAQDFGAHSHRDMEIVSYVLEGALEHRDSMGTGSVLRPGDVQRMSAGTGVTHSELNHSSDEPVHFLQVWILPERSGLEPEYEEKRFSEDQKRGRLRLIVSPDGRDGSVRIHQDASIYASILGAGETTHHDLERGRHAWIQVARGAVNVNGETLGRGDGLAISGVSGISLSGEGADGTELLLFDLG